MGQIGDSDWSERLGKLGKRIKSEAQELGEKATPLVSDIGDKFGPKVSEISDKATSQISDRFSSFGAQMRALGKNSPKDDDRVATAPVQGDSASDEDEGKDEDDGGDEGERPSLPTPRATPAGPALASRSVPRRAPQAPRIPVMTDMSTVGEPEEKRSVWRNPFVLGLMGILALMLLLFVVSQMGGSRTGARTETAAVESAPQSVEAVADAPDCVGKTVAAAVKKLEAKGYRPSVVMGEEHLDLEEAAEYFVVAQDQDGWWVDLEVVKPASDQVGQPLDVARTALETEGFQVEVATAGDNVVSNESDWMVTRQAQEGSKVELTVDLRNPEPVKPPEDSTAVDGSTGLDPAAVEAKFVEHLQNNFIDEISSMCGFDGDYSHWACFYDGVGKAGTFLRIKLTTDGGWSDYELSDLAERTARHWYNFVGCDFPEMTGITVTINGLDFNEPKSSFPNLMPCS